MKLNIIEAPRRNRGESAWRQWQMRLAGEDELKGIEVVICGPDPDVVHWAHRRLKEVIAHGTLYEQCPDANPVESIPALVPVGVPETVAPPPTPARIPEPPADEPLDPDPEIPEDGGEPPATDGGLKLQRGGRRKN